MRRSKYTKDLLEPIALTSVSLGQVIKKLGLRLTGGNYRMISSRLRLCGIPTDHFRGQGWAKGETQLTHPGVAQNAFRLAIPNEEVFIENSPVINGPRLIKRLIRLGWKYECMECGLVAWHGKPISLHLDHLNGIHNDNRLENLRLLCPNCHSQTPTYCRRKES